MEPKDSQKTGYESGFGLSEGFTGWNVTLLEMTSTLATHNAHKIKGLKML